MSSFIGSTLKSKKKFDVSLFILLSLTYNDPMNRTIVEEIKARLPIEEVIGSYVKLEKSGKSYKARCPFHNEKTPSFFVSTDRSGYYCFGCGAKGDIFSFVEQFEGLDFRGALKVLAERAGVPLVNDTKADGERDRLFAIMEDAAKFFQDQLKANAEASAYVKKRGISPESCASFRIGWAPEGWQHCREYLHKKGWSDAIIEKAGLIKRKEQENGTVVIPTKVGIQDPGRGKVLSHGVLDPDLRRDDTKIDGVSPDSVLRTPFSSSYYDRFRGRIMFPITDSSGRVIAFTGRILKDDGQSAKYLNSPETPIFNKSQILFGLDKAKTEIRKAGYSVLVEGQMDLVLSHQVGVRNAVAASGTALTDQALGQTGIVSNLGMVRRLSPNMIIALDSDAAGRMATMKAVAATALAMGMSVKIAEIEGGKDPADLILSDPNKWKEALKNAKHVIEFELGNVMREVTDPHKVARALRERVFPFLSKIDSEMDKAYYVKIIAEETHLSETAVWDDLRKVKTPPIENREQKTENRISSQTASSQISVLSSQFSGASSHRLDLVERRMFGLLGLLDAAKSPKASIYREQIRKIAGPYYDECVKRLESMMSDILFEADAFFGAKPDIWESHMEELILNFEEDLINDELLRTMGELRIAEKNGEPDKASAAAVKCQELSKKKAELSKQRKK